MSETQQPGLIGARVRRVEDPRFLTGQTRYVDDMPFTNTLYAAFARSTHAHARLKRVDAGAAQKLPGVVRIVTGEETAKNTNPIRCDSTMPGFKPADFPALPQDRARFAGQAVAIVVAGSRYVAEDAAEQIEIDYEPLPVVADVEAAAAPDSPVLFAEWGDNLQIRRAVNLGDVDKAFAEADFVWKGRLKSARSTGYPMEHRACVARFDQAQGVLHYWCATQIPHLLRTGLADALNFPENRIQVYSLDVGGGFGIKAHLFPEDVALCYAAMQVPNRPIKWLEDSREHLMACIHAREHVHFVEVAATKDGTITGLRARLLVDVGAYSVWPWTSTMDTGMALGILPGPYKIRNYQCEAYSVATNKCPLGPYRGVSRPCACFSIERAVDEVAHGLGLDPQAVRRKNYVQPEDFPYTSITGLIYDSASLVDALEKVKGIIGYDHLRREQERLRAQGRYLGIGIAAYIEQTAHATKEFIKRGVPIIFGYDSVKVRIDPSGTVTVHSSGHSHGQGHETTIGQVVADRLGVPLSDVRVSFGDTDSVPYGMGTFASRSAVLAGGAAWKSATAVRENVLKIAGQMLEAAPADLTIADGVISIKGAPGRKLTVAEVARAAYHRPEKLPEGMMPTDLEIIQSYDADPGTGTFANACHAAVVEVDPETGELQILRYVVVEDCGTMINPLVVDGQVQGGTAQGIGGALLEELVYDENGQMLSASLMDYMLPTAVEIPNIEVFHLQTPSPFTIGGIKGMGEGGAIAPGPCLANAVSDALAPFNIEVRELPLTPERILGMMAQAAQR